MNSTPPTSPSDADASDSHAPPPAAAGYAPVAAGPPAGHARLSWSAVMAGSLLAAAVTLLLLLLGAGAGLVTTDSIGTADELALGAGIWLVIAGSLGLFVGGWAAACLADRPGSAAGVLHGLCAWSVTTVLSFWFLVLIGSSLLNAAATLGGSAMTGAGQAVGGVASGAGQTMGGIASGAGQAASGMTSTAVEQLGDVVGSINWEDTSDLARDLIVENAPQAGLAARDAAGEPAESAVAIGDFSQKMQQYVTSDSDVHKTELARYLTDNSGLSESEAYLRLAQVKQGYLAAVRQAEAAYAAAGRTATEAGDMISRKAGEYADDVRQAAQTGYRATTDFLGSLALWAFVVLLLGALCSAVGGSMGARGANEIRRA